MNKDFKYIIKRVFIGVLVGVILFCFKSCNAKAYTNNVISGDAEFPTGNATFLSMNENYRITNVGYRYFFGSTLNPTLYFASPTTNNVTCGTYGCGISIDGLSTVKDSYYSITIFLLGDSSPYWHYSYSSLTNKVGVSNGYSTIDPDYFVAPISGTTGLSRSCGTQYDNEYTGNCLFQWTILFKSPRNGSTVQTWWSSNPAGADPQDVGLFVGYNFQYVGDSSLTPEQLNAALNNVTTSINNNINTNAQNIINNDNANTNRLIGSISDMADDILTGQEQQTQYLIESEKACNTIDKNNIYTSGKYLNSGGGQDTLAGAGITDYINILNSTIIFDTPRENNLFYTCFYNESKVKISCFPENVTGEINIPNNAVYMRVSIWSANNKPIVRICKNGNQAINDSLDDINKSINDDNVDAQDSQINDLINNSAFNDTTGLSSVISAPLRILNNLTNQCQPINLSIPYMNTDFSIPCMSTEVYSKFPSGFINTIAVIVNGFLVYRIVLSLYGMIHKFKDPEDDKIEVVDL